MRVAYDVPGPFLTRARSVTVVLMPGSSWGTGFALDDAGDTVVSDRGCVLPAAFWAPWFALPPVDVGPAAGPATAPPDTDTPGASAGGSTGPGEGLWFCAEKTSRRRVMTAAAIFGSKSGFSSSVGTSGRCGRTRCVMWTSIANLAILYVTFSRRACFCRDCHPSVTAEGEACGPHLPKDGSGLPWSVRRPGRACAVERDGRFSRCENDVQQPGEILSVRKRNHIDVGEFMSVCRLMTRGGENCQRRMTRLPTSEPASLPA